MRNGLVCISIILLAVAGFAGINSKDGNVVPDTQTAPGEASSVRADFEYNTAGAIDAVPTTGGSWDGWAEYFITLVVNNSGDSLTLTELGFPCNGTIPGSWGVWIGAAQPSDFQAPHYSGPYTAVDTSDNFPPTVYTYIDVTADNIVVPDGESFWIGYLNPGQSGQIDFNGVETYGWYVGAWDPDSAYGRTTVLQVKADITIPVELQSITVE